MLDVRGRELDFSHLIQPRFLHILKRNAHETHHNDIH